MRGKAAQLLLLLLCGAWLFCSCARTETEAPSPPEILPDGVIAIGARELYDAYVEDEQAADRQYKDKILEVSGKVTMKRPLFGACYIVLGSTTLMSTWAVDCVFTDTTDPRLVKVARGDKVRIRGRCEGLELDIILKECRLIDLEPKE